MKVRYRGTALGILWSFFNPVLMTAVYTAIFGTAFSKYYDGSVVRYVLSAFVGLVVVTFFMNATSEALSTVVANGSLLNKIALPPVIFPLASVAANLFQQGVTTFPIVFVVSIAVTHDPVRVMLVPVVLASVVLLVTGISLALATLFVFFRDLPHLWAITGFILWLTSPMFYPIDVVPAAIRPWYDANPVGQAIVALREVSITRGPIHFGPIVFVVLAGVVAAVLGAWFFRVARRDFMDLI
ncbi:MAG: ABC transporter permease [Candidatus Eremiobacteraeota bacterium]|nr:ABC transporter permease [Candidatus Eremiobacteraeota bacterium]